MGHLWQKNLRLFRDLLQGPERRRHLNYSLQLGCTFVHSQQAEATTASEGEGKGSITGGNKYREEQWAAWGKPSDEKYGFHDQHPMTQGRLQHFPVKKGLRTDAIMIIMIITVRASLPLFQLF